MYNKVTSQDIEFLKTIVPAEDVIVGDAISPDFGKDELGTVSNMPEVLVYVTKTTEVSSIMKYANEHLIPVVARGSGTGLVGACVPLEGGIVIDTVKMNHILELDENNLTTPGIFGISLTPTYW